MRPNQIPIFLRPVAVAAGATPVPVQTSGLVSYDADITANKTVPVGTAAASFTAGNTAVICISHYHGLSGRISGVSFSGTAAVLVSRSIGTTTNYSSEIWSATNIAGGSTAVVISQDTSNPNYVYASFEEWGSMAASSLDVSVTGTKSTGTSNSISSGALAQAKEVVYATMQNATGAADSIAGPTGFVQTALVQRGAGLAIAAGYKIVNSTASVTANFTNASSIETLVAMGTFKGA